MRFETASAAARKGLTFAIAVSVVATGFLSSGVSASAQELIRRKPWTLFDIFRGPEPDRRRYIDRYPDTPRARPLRTKKPVARNTARRSAAGAASVTAPPIEAVEKRADAKTVLVVGDFMGSGLAEGLTAQFVQNADVKVVDRTQGSSGFVREDVYDWDKELPGLIETEKPAAIVVMMGSNDRQPMRAGGETRAFGSEEWNKEYAARTAALADVLEKSKTPYLWIGLPSFKSARMTIDMLAFNDIYKAVAEANGGEFVDIWDGFVDGSGAFVTTGPDINGQPARLRGADGINLTKAGKAKVAFYADKPLRKLLGLGGTIAPALPAVPDAGAPKDQPLLDRTPPISLNDPELDGGSELLGAQPTPAASPAPRGPAAPETAPPPGRADDSSWSSREADRLLTRPVETTTAITR